LPAPHVGAPTDALTALVDTAASQVKRSELARPDARVSVAFALGWQVAEIYRPDRGTSTPPASVDDLPGLARLSEQDLAQIALDQVQAGITKLRDPILQAGLDPPGAQGFAARLRAITGEDDRRAAIREFHIELLGILTAADFRLGKAYGLGRAMADTTRPPVDHRAELAPQRVAMISEWVRDLASALQPHAAHPVAESLDAWSCWATATQERHAVERTVAKLEAQGRLWRSLLSGEKRATDMLETSDYVRAGEGLLQRSATLGQRFLKHYWWLALIIALLFAVGVVVVATSSSPAAVVGGAGAILGSLGLSWKGIGTSVGSAAARAEQPLWDAEVDTVIYERITPQEIVESQRTVIKGPDEPSLVTR
jgi:hypothetical protein